MANYFDQFDGGVTVAPKGEQGPWTQYQQPPLPEGFTLDKLSDDQLTALYQRQQSATPQLPPGFVLDNSGGGIGATFSDVPREIYNAGAGALSAINAGLNPFSDERRARLERQANAPSFLSGMAEQVGDLAETGKGLLAIPGLVAAPIAGAARSIIGHPFAALTGKPYEEAKGDVDTAMLALSPRGATPRGIRTTPAAIPTEAEISAAATGGFDSVQHSNATVKGDAIRKLATTVADDLHAKGIRRGKFASETHGILEDLQNGKQDFTLADLKAERETLGQAAGSIDPRERFAAVQAKEALDKYLSNIPKADIVAGDPAAVAATLKDAIGNYANLKRAEDFSFRGEKAQNNAAGANSGMNLENNLRNQVKQILNNKKLQRGYDAETLDAFRRFNSGSRAANVVRAVGNMLGGGGGWTTLAAAGIGHLAIPGLGAATPAVGFAVKALGNARAAKQFERLQEMIRARSPLAQSRPPVPVSQRAIPGLLGLSSNVGSQ